MGAGSGTRLRPLTIDRPKVLCPVGNIALIDHALARLGAVTDAVAVNAHITQASLIQHVAGRAEVSVEAGVALGTAGGVAALRDWVDGRGALVVNGDTWATAPLDLLLTDWDGERIRVLVDGAEPFGPRSRIVGSLLPAPVVAALAPTPSGLWEVVWRDALAHGRIESIPSHGQFVDCADPADYLRANLAASHGESVVGAGADVRGRLHQCVVWPGAVVHADEELVRAIRTDTGRTVLVRR